MNWQDGVQRRLSTGVRCYIRMGRRPGGHGKWTPLTNSTWFRVGLLTLTTRRHRVTEWRTVRKCFTAPPPAGCWHRRSSLRSHWLAASRQSSVVSRRRSSARHRCCRVTSPRQTRCCHLPAAIESKISNFLWLSIFHHVYQAKCYPSSLLAQEVLIPPSTVEQLVGVSSACVNEVKQRFRRRTLCIYSENLSHWQRKYNLSVKGPHLRFYKTLHPLSEQLTQYFDGYTTLVQKETPAGW